MTRITTIRKVLVAIFVLKMSIKSYHVKYNLKYIKMDPEKVKLKENSMKNRGESRLTHPNQGAFIKQPLLLHAQGFYRKVIKVKQN